MQKAPHVTSSRASSSCLVADLSFMAVESPSEAVGWVEPDPDDKHKVSTEGESLKLTTTALTMPVGQTELTLHSPSTIIGTPFDVESPRFEYPFPESSSRPTETLHSLVSAASSISSLASLQSPLNHITPIHLPQPDIPALLPVRTKVRTETIPIPPGLVEKRHRWSLGERKLCGEGEDSSNKGDRPSERNNGQRRRGSSVGRENNAKTSQLPV
ncbi:uncharacterized protein EV420DRAFT_1499353 [Desarmillaria tabescens]|uniref:Uncharacterized protein n=1 Tax=Armillaria tabescens TaxID=1929756 RepID=A0AA39NRG2_ARMTA|nr:uncharacterized protein EV420DRAFT_1499353 [Desarmillaria tabescens]KAK0470254.1 hypothetical protein EV420DRAFT_1499353 [Desarmillaria tabescens]